MGTVLRLGEQFAYSKYVAGAHDAIRLHCLKEPRRTVVADRQTMLQMRYPRIPCLLHDEAGLGIRQSLIFPCLRKPPHDGAAKHCGKSDRNTLRTGFPKCMDHQSSPNHKQCVAGNLS